jgi:S-adenosylmethionine:tRNA ribosyltransferase-isomerase
LIKLLDAPNKENIVAVGTTSLRTLESLYWLGVQQFNAQQKDNYVHNPTLNLTQWEAYELEANQINPTLALSALIKHLEKTKSTHLFAKTQLMVTPGYHFKICNALVTNFHQPKSTLLLIIAAITGDEWKTIYNYALNNQFRFLSYGDGSLLWINKN